MLGNWLKGSEWSALLDLVSPRFFDVLPARELQREVRALAANYTSRSRQAAVRVRVGALLEHSGLPLRLASDESVPERVAAMDRGQAVLRLYFLQLMASPEALLDLRHHRFVDTGHGLDWDPRPLYVSWDPAFLSPLRRLYLAFYEGQEGAFRDALRELDLAPAEASLRDSFGGSKQHAVSFRVADFRRTFHEAFRQCERNGCVLHHNFASLGVYLACLYQHLESVGGAHDVRAAFSAVRSGTTPESGARR